MRPPEDRSRARSLRRRGVPYRRIAAELRIAPSTAVAWTRDIGLTAEMTEQNLRGPDGPLNSDAAARRAASWSARCRRARATYQEEGRRRARQGDPLHLAGSMLYWAEGGKHRNCAQFVNSDPQMIRLFRRFLVEALEVDPGRLRLCLNVYTNNGLTIEEIERYWLDLLDLPRTCLRGHSLNHMPTSSSGRARRRLPYGVCTLRIGSTAVVQHIFGAIQEYAGFEEPAWLD